VRIGLSNLDGDSGCCAGASGAGSSSTGRHQYKTAIGKLDEGAMEGLFGFLPLMWESKAGKRIA